jgi:hypothetical protein
MRYLHPEGDYSFGFGFDFDQWERGRGRNNTAGFERVRQPMRAGVRNPRDIALRAVVWRCPQSQDSISNESSAMPCIDEISR